MDHRSATNAPHVTVVAAPVVPSSSRDAARRLLAPLLPVRARVSALLVLGGARVTLARAVDVDDDVTGAVLTVRAGVPDRRHAGWLPHLTLARRLPRQEVQRAVDALGWDDAVLSLAELRFWDPHSGTVTRLAPP